MPSATPLLSEQQQRILRGFLRAGSCPADGDGFNPASDLRGRRRHAASPSTSSPQESLDLLARLFGLEDDAIARRAAAPRSRVAVRPGLAYGAGRRHPGLRTQSTSTTHSGGAGGTAFPLPGRGHRTRTTSMRAAAAAAATTRASSPGYAPYFRTRPLVRAFVAEKDGDDVTRGLRELGARRVGRRRRRHPRRVVERELQGRAGDDGEVAASPGSAPLIPGVDLAGGSSRRFPTARRSRRATEVLNRQARGPACSTTAAIVEHARVPGGLGRAATWTGCPARAGDGASAPAGYTSGGGALRDRVRGVEGLEPDDGAGRGHGRERRRRLATSPTSWPPAATRVVASTARAIREWLRAARRGLGRDRARRRSAARRRPAASRAPLGRRGGGLRRRRRSSPALLRSLAATAARWRRAGIPAA